MSTKPDPILPPRPSGDDHARRAFETAAHDAGFDPDDPWIGGYVAYEWQHLRLLLDAYGLDVHGAHVLEFGCNVAASSIVMAQLGARVQGVDVAAEMLTIGRANAALHVMADRITLTHTEPGSPLPFADGAFDFILANSVLEYVDPADLDLTMAELHRTLAPGGRLLVCGTASRLAPREIHSRRWLVNYLPRALDRATGQEFQRGLSPWSLKRAIAGRFDIGEGGRWLRARQAVHGEPSAAVRVFAKSLTAMGLHPGLYAPNIELLLTRPQAQGGG